MGFNRKHVTIHSFPTHRTMGPYTLASSRNSWWWFILKTGCRPISGIPDGPGGRRPFVLLEKKQTAVRRASKRATP